MAFSAWCLATALALGVAAPGEYFVIRVVDAATGRGVPLVELRTTAEVCYYTDSAGVVAFLEPGLMDRRVYFHVSSPGYEHAADGFGYRGVALDVRPGASAAIELKRTQVAERVCRLTGAGIYRDSVLAGLPAPLRRPVLADNVTGQDSVHAALYRGKVRWFWGDTNRVAYPLGNFGTSGAVSTPGDDPADGIDFTYFADAEGFSRPMLPIAGPGPVWVSGVGAVENGTRLVAFYSRVEGLVRALERGIAVYDDARDVLVSVARFDAAQPLPLDGHPFLGVSDGRAYLVGTREGVSPLPSVRAAATVEALKDPAGYDAYTCLVPAPAGSLPAVERDAQGRPVYRWRKGGAPAGGRLLSDLVKAGAMKPEEALLQMRDAETGRTVTPHNGSVYWNAYRRRWVMVFNQSGGEGSLLGDVWYAEADTAVGPWAYARKVASHPRMDFYNPTHHPFMDRDGGRAIYFEGTFVNTFSGHPTPVPWYNYNQLLYRLSLDDPRLAVPAPVYRLDDGALVMRDDLRLPEDAARIREVAFFAIPGTRGGSGAVTLYSDAGQPTSSPRQGARALGSVLPASTQPAGHLVPVRDAGGAVLGMAWRSPHAFVAADWALAPVR